MELTPTQAAIVSTDGHLLVTGGPGSGKTTAAILKATWVAETALRSEQSILFLSFARATVSRVLEAIDEEDAIATDAKNRIEVDTYHAFFWRILRAHGYLIGLPRRLTLVTPPNEAIELSAIRRKYKAESRLSAAEKIEKEVLEENERIRLAEKEGRVSFGLFARYVGNMLHTSAKVRRLVTTAYPVIILDEFQDTTADQWRVVKALSIGSTLIALADPEQRIYEFAGAEAKRIQQFKDAVKPTVFDLKADNHRSKGTDIVAFGNDILRGSFSKQTYEGIAFLGFEPNQNQAFAALAGQTLQARQRRLQAGKKNWCIGVLVPTRKMARQVSDAFRSPLGSMPAIRHAAAVDMEAVVLAAEVLAHLLEQGAGFSNYERCADLICAFYRGKGGDTPSKTSLNEADVIQRAFAKCLEKETAGEPPPGKNAFSAVRASIDQSRQIILTGDPDSDWLAMRKVLEQSACARLREIAGELLNLRLLERGTQLRQALAADWRGNGSYANALAITRQAFVREHFASARKPETGVVVMNMHKAKGKQFDEVIIFEGWPRYAKRQLVSNPDRIVRNNQRTGSMEQAQQNFRVSVTRAKLRTTILTPKGDPCVLLVPQKPKSGT
jgi:DNA helicase II / ATP-dependent DNA helicase PcrA